MQKNDRHPHNRLRYIRNLLLVFILALIIVFYGILPPIQAAQAIHPTRYPIGEVSPAQLGLEYEDIRLTTADGLMLPGWFIYPKIGWPPYPAIIAVHAYNGNRSGVIYHAALLAEYGYAVLAFDLRAHGESEGEQFAFGWDADQDVFAALEYLQSRADVDAQRIGGLGLSIGAEIILEAAGSNPNLRAVVAEGGGIRNFADWMQGPSAPGYLDVPGAWWFWKSAELLTGLRQPAPLTEMVGRISPNALLLISAGGENRFAALLFAAAGEPKQHWARPESGHIDALFKHPQEYEQTVIQFLGSALK
jgi:fermentation-respiration switch protein FrsA (DUF1100 family)